MRLLLTSLTIVSVLVGNFFLTIVLMLVGLLYYPRYLEVIAIGGALELLYRGGGGLLGVAGALTIICFAAFLLVEVLRMYIRTQPE